jgi:hypothetical protein
LRLYKRKRGYKALVTAFLLIALTVPQPIQAFCLLLPTTHFSSRSTFKPFPELPLNLLSFSPFIIDAQSILSSGFYPTGGNGKEGRRGEGREILAQLTSLLYILLHCQVIPFLSHLSPDLLTVCSHLYSFCITNLTHSNISRSLLDKT